MIEGIVPREIREGPAAIRETVASAGPDARRVAATWRERGISRVHVIGNGTSYHSALAASALYRRRSQPGDPVVIPVTSADFRTYPPALGPNDAIVGISSSGEFKDVVGVARDVRGRIPMAEIGRAHV